MTGVQTCALPIWSATNRRLGGPLPHQLPNRTRVHLSPIKSLVAEPCDPATLCGISVRFQTLSPMPRQVAHALLTRPPLSLLRSIRRLPLANSVRLECVMHAASVHPEPGSNSRIICINSSLLRCNYHSSFFSSFFYFCLSSILS